MILKLGRSDGLNTLTIQKEKLNLREWNRSGRKIVRGPTNKQESEMESDKNTIIRDHLHNGFVESQKVIQFQDLKATSILGLSTLILGGVYALASTIGSVEVKKDLTLISSLPNYPCLFLLFLTILSFAFIALTVGCVWKCIKCIRPAKPLNKTFHPYILFPIYNGSSEQSRKLEEFHKEFSDSVDENTAFKKLAEDYRGQAIQLGRILDRKINAIREAITLIWYQLMVSAFLGASLIVLLITSV